MTTLTPRPPNLILSAESDLLELLQKHPMMPPTLLVRPFTEDVMETGRTINVDNLILKFNGINYESTFESEDDIAQKWIVTFELMFILRDLRGHHSALQLFETVSHLLTNYRVLHSSRPIAPRNLSWNQQDDNDFRYWSMTFDYEIEPCRPTYSNEYEAVPKEFRCLSKDGCQWTGVNDNGVTNTCWRRYVKPGDENNFRYYNGCSQKEGDEETNTFFGTQYGCSGIQLPDKFDIDIAVWRSTTLEDVRAPIPTKLENNENLAAKIEVTTGEDVIQYSSYVCKGCI